MHDVYKLKELICDELEEYGKKGEVTANNLEVIYKLSSIAKNLAKVIKMYEEEEDESYSSMSPYYYDDGMGGRSYARDGRGSRGGRGGMSYARGNRSGGRGRGSNARRDSIGRYSSEGGYSGADEAMDDVLMDMKELMQDMPQEKKMKMQRFIQEMEQM